MKIIYITSGFSFSVDFFKKMKLRWYTFLNKWERCKNAASILKKIYVSAICYQNNNELVDNADSVNFRKDLDLTDI